MGKGMLATERDNLADHLYPHQLAVAVRSGSEVMPHLGRQWLVVQAEEPDKVLIDFDEGNARNEVDRDKFLLRASQVAPGICSWLEYIYPTDQPTYVFYRGRVIESRAGWQQGCPLKGLGHALVQRVLLEAIGEVPVDARTTQLAPILDPPAWLDMAPGFADDGFLAGDSGEVLRALQHIMPLMPALGLRFSRLEAIPAAGLRSTFDEAAYRHSGCTINKEQCVSIMKSPIGTIEFCEQ